MTAFQTRRRVEFRDTDAAGIMHFSAYFVYMEEAEHEMLRDLGLSVIMHDAQGVISWPRVSASCQYEGAVKFEDILDIQLCVRRLGEKSVTYGFEFSCHGRRVATGEMTAVCCRIDQNAPLQAIPIPQEIATQLATCSCPE